MMPTGGVNISLINTDISFQTSTFKEKKGYISSAFMRQIICHHQGAIIEHIYLAAELHKDLRIACEREDKAKIADLLNKIDNDLPDRFENSWIQTVRMLTNYFDASHANHTIVPRICIKASKTVDDNKCIVDVFRSDGHKSDLLCKVSDNTGFSEVDSSKTYYLNNNIPNACSKNEYKNPRINNDLVKKYKQRKFGFNKKKIDESWTECWDDYKKEKGNWGSCYKSTLIIPMTLINNHQSSRFINDTMIGISKHDKYIYGFLCFDHMASGYFNKDDINVGYIIADLLSFYMINQLNFTIYSSVFTKANKILKKENK